jgi:hypothetical protein
MGALHNKRTLQKEPSRSRASRKAQSQALEAYFPNCVVPKEMQSTQRPRSLRNNVFCAHQNELPSAKRYGPKQNSKASKVHFKESVIAVITTTSNQ